MCEVPFLSQNFVIQERNISEHCRTLSGKLRPVSSSDSLSLDVAWSGGSSAWLEEEKKKNFSGVLQNLPKSVSFSHLLLIEKYYSSYLSFHGPQ